MNTVRWGLLSTANINRPLIPTIRMSRRGKLIAVASRTRERADKYALEWDIPFSAILKSGTIDAVYIGLPNYFHAEWSIRALKTGVNVLCEKPFALSLDEVDAMISTHQDTGLVLAEAFMYRHHPQTKTAGEWIQKGNLRVIDHFRGVFNFSYCIRKNIRLIPEYGGGCLWDVGVYPLSFAQLIFGNAPIWVVGSRWNGDTGVDETFCGQMHYKDDRIAQISSSFRTPWYTAVEIFRTEGRLFPQPSFHWVG